MGDGKTSGEVHYACRIPGTYGDWTLNMAQEVDYYKNFFVLLDNLAGDSLSLKECQARCEAEPNCTGIEYAEIKTYKRCEIWMAPHVPTAGRTDFYPHWCLRYGPADRCLPSGELWAVPAGGSTCGALIAARSKAIGTRADWEKESTARAREDIARKYHECRECSIAGPCDRSCITSTGGAEVIDTCRHRISWLVQRQGRNVCDAVRTVNAECAGQCGCAKDDPVGSDDWQCSSGQALHRRRRAMYVNPTSHKVEHCGADTLIDEASETRCGEKF